MDRSISIRGARTHNLADISLEIPREKLTVVTGVSGSGKSSLVFDTVYAEGQRRYVQSLSTYARLFLERMERPDVDSISEIPPALALRQKNSIKNARSTVGTVTEISDYLRLLFATVGRTVCPKCGGEVSRDTVESAGAQILATPGLYVMLAPFEAGSRSIPDAAGYLIQNGYHRIYANDAITETAEFAARAIAAEGQNGTSQQPQPPIDSTMMVVVDRISVNNESEGVIERVREALEKAFYLGAGRARAVRVERDNGNTHSVGAIDFDRRFNCSRCATAFAEPTTALFSSNSPIGACPECEGFGRTVELDLDKVLPDHSRSMRNGLVAPWRTPAYREMNEWMLKLARRRKIRTSAPYRELTDEERTWLLDGDEGPRAKWDEDKWPGVHGFFKWLEGRRYKTHVRILLAKYRRFVTCPACTGAKLKPEALNVLVDGVSIAAVGRLSIRDLVTWLDKIQSIAEVADAGGGRDARAAQSRRLPARSRPRLSDRRAAGAHAVGRRGATDSSGERARQRAGRNVVCPRRADGWTARGGRAGAARGAVQPARLRQHGGRRRARSGDDRGRRSRGRAWTGRRQRGWRADVLGTAGEGDARQHGVVARAGAADARDRQAAQIHQTRSGDSDRRRARAQSRRHRRRAAGGPHDLRDRSFRIGKIDPGRGRAVQQLSAPARATPRRRLASATGSTGSS